MKDVAVAPGRQVALAVKRMFVKQIGATRVVNHIMTMDKPEQMPLKHDLLRSLIVSLHATLEDFLKAVCAAKGKGSPSKISGWDQVVGCLRKNGFARAKFATHKRSVEWTLTRRHRIAHNGDFPSAEVWSQAGEPRTRVRGRRAPAAPAAVLRCRSRRDLTAPSRVTTLWG